MSNARIIVIVGASTGGANAAETPRAEGFRRSRCADRFRSDRPLGAAPLVKGFLDGTIEKDEIYVRDAFWYAEQDVDLMLAQGESCRPPC